MICNFKTTAPIDALILSTGTKPIWEITPLQ